MSQGHLPMMGAAVSLSNAVPQRPVQQQYSWTFAQAMEVIASSIEQQKVIATALNELLKEQRLTTQAILDLTAALLQRLEEGPEEQEPPVEPEPEQETLAVILKRARLAKGWSLTELAKAAGLSVSSVSGFERGNEKYARKATLITLAMALDLVVADLERFVAPARVMKKKERP